MPSRVWLGTTAESGTVVAGPALLLPEVGGALARQPGRRVLAQRAIALLERLPTIRLVVMDTELAHAAAELATDLQLRGADAVYVALAVRLGVPLVTWDNEQRERGGARIETFTPAELLAGQN